MVKLAINAVSLAAGGGLTGLLGYLEAWREIGADLDITVFASRPTVLESVRRARPDVEVVAFGVGLPLYRRFLLERSALAEAIRGSACDVVMTTNMLVPRCSSPQIVHHRNLLLFERVSTAKLLLEAPRRILQRHLAAKALRRSAANIFISDYLRREAERCVPGSRSRDVVIHNGLSEQVIAGSARPSRWNGEPVLFAVTSQDPHKENETLLRALFELVSRRPDVAWSLAVASTGDLTREQGLARRLDLDSKIRWLGCVDEDGLDRHYRESLCLMFTSTIEGFGNPTLEAMARRCPVVASRSTAIPEVVGDAGLLVEPSNPRAFADAACRLLDDQALRSDLVAKGLERIREFRWVDSAARFYEVARHVARGVPRSRGS